MGGNNWNKPDPPWQESGFWGGGIEPDEDDLGRIACHSAQYRAGWQEANKIVKNYEATALPHQPKSQ